MGFKLKGTLCDLKREEIEENWSAVCDLVRKPKYVCRKCARGARCKDHLCKPKRIAPAEE